jgi:multidrug efflux pump subunit AcrA (membrane-fusion protein)
VFLVARVDEADRGAIRAGQKASVRADAVAERDYTGTVTEISILARADFASWPPTKMFDLKISLDTPDDRLRPGMSAVARIGVGSVDNVLLVPAGAVFRVGGRDVVYRFRSGAFEAVPVQVVRRGREEAALASGVNPGDRIALTNPEPAPEEGK